VTVVFAQPISSGDDVEERVQELETRCLMLIQAQGVLEKELKKFRDLFDLAIAMTSDHSMDDTLQLIVDKCRELLHADISYISLQDESSGEFFKHTSAGIRTEAFRQMRLPPGMGLAALVAGAGQGYITEDYLAETFLDPVMRDIVASEGIVAGMAVPVQMASKNLGLLYVFNRTRTTFSQADLGTLFLIGNLAAVEISRKEAEKSLRESEERFRFMAETTGDVIYRLRFDSMNYDYLSPGIKKLTGFSPQEITALGFAKLVQRIDLPGKENVPPHIIVRDRMDGKIDEYRADYLIQTRSGGTKWLRDHSFPWVDETSKPIGSVGILSDISEYKRAEMLVRERTGELTASEEKYRTLVENVPLVVYRIKSNGKILFVNQFVEEVFGYTAAEMIGNPGLWNETLHDDDRLRVEEQRERIYRRGDELITEYRVKHKHGHTVEVMDHAIPLRAEEGTISIVDGIILDISWMVRLHENLVRAEGLKTISEVSARLAHEIRNPLVSAGGFARRLLSSMSADDPNRAKVEIIVKEVGRLEAILRMILNYLQPLELDASAADLNDLVDMALDGLRNDFKRHEVDLDVQLAHQLPEITVDRKLLKHVFETLLRNALTQMPKGSRATIRTSRKEDILELMLRYPAQHLSGDDVEHFFYPFTASRVAYGAMDLPMCKIVVNKHDGAIDVHLEPPKELVILVSLPVRDDRPKKVLRREK
jgi:PAS domain S-box-containing protein